MPVSQHTYDFIISMSWFFLAAGCIFYCRQAIRLLIQSIRIIRVRYKDTEIFLTQKQISDTLAELLEDMTSVVEGLSKPEKELYAKIRTSDGRKTVEQYFPNFQRESDEHEMLRALRSRKLVRPFEGGPWVSEKKPIRTRFSEIVERHLSHLLRNEL